jgi:hypothetical protein
MEEATQTLSAEPLADAEERHQALRDKVTIAVLGLIAFLALVGWLAG